MIELSTIRWAAEECERQHSGEKSVYNMCSAWNYAFLLFKKNKDFDRIDIENLGYYVEPQKNLRGFRRTPVIVGGHPISATNINSQINRLLDFGNNLTPIEFYKEFEEIHPFIDGNGRVGSILFNLLSGTICNPIAPPDVFHITVKEK